ncbi:hypothetical protein [Undibacterium curvum]|uniref:hypothetical protein n=1 Tax=Undibacterium curvum TaxID=2762294 RepID=UPI003D0D6BD9
MSWRLELRIEHPVLKTSAYQPGIAEWCSVWFACLMALDQAGTPATALALLVALSAFFSIAGIALHHSATW